MARYVGARVCLSVVISLSGLAALPLNAQTDYSVGPPPRWVSPIQVGPIPIASEGAVTGGYEVLLFDHQDAVTPAAIERFTRIRYRLLDERAVEANSQLELTFDPSYERLTLHAVTVTRDGRVIDQLRPSQIRVVETESERDYRLLDGSRSLLLVLEDVRRGDVVEYSYTRRGANPVFAGHYMMSIPFQGTVPIGEVHFRLLWPSGRPLFVRQPDSMPEPSITTQGSQREYVWTTEDVPARIVDPDTPSWYDPLPRVSLSDFASWRAVSAWGDSLFRTTGPVPAALRARIAKIRTTNPTKQAQVLAALRYVQDSIRYFGVEIGVNSHRPYPLAVVLSRGYGDCKDKVAVLTAMLRELGVPAWPALVSTELRGHLGEYQPSADHFDHAILYTEVDGHPYWLDPTALYERGPLGDVVPPYGAALVLGRLDDSLTTIPEALPDDPTADIAVSLDLSEVGTPSRMRVETDYRRRAANSMRERTRSISSEQLEHGFTEYYASAYPDIRSERPPIVTDHEDTNVLHVSEAYSIPEFWRLTASGRGRTGTFVPVELEDAVGSASATKRTMPLGVVFPSYYRYKITARIGSGWVIAPRADTVASTAMHFERDVSAQGEELSIRYQYRTLADHVTAPEAPEHLAAVARVDQLLRFGVEAPATADGASVWSNPEELNFSVLLVALMATGLGVFAAMRLYRSTAPSWLPPPNATDDGLQGIGGWLVVVGFGLCVRPILVVRWLVRSGPAYAASSWARHTTPSEPNYHPLWAVALLFELVANLQLIIFGCLLLWQFIRRSRWFPPLFILVALGTVIIQLTDLALSNLLPAIGVSAKAWTNLVRTVLWTVVWVWYMIRSKRVRNTFLR